MDSLEFARGSANSTWGSVRAKMGHPKPFPVKYVAIGNEDCERKFYRGKTTVDGYFSIASVLLPMLVQKIQRLCSLFSRGIVLLVTRCSLLLLDR